MFFFFNDTATTEIYTLSLYDALPISLCRRSAGLLSAGRIPRVRARRGGPGRADHAAHPRDRLEPAAQSDRRRSEEHTSELPSQSNLLCRLLLVEKNTHPPYVIITLSQ